MKVSTVGLGLALTLVTSLTGVSAQQQDQGGRAMVDHERQSFLLASSELQRIVKGFQIAPVPLSLEGLDVALVGLGSYLVNAAGGCNDCHTNPPFVPGGDPFLGQRKQINAANYLAGGIAFGPFVSRNLTPDPATGLPSGFTFQQFRRVMRTGVDLKQLPPHVPSEARDLLQVMPWPVFQELTERDLRAMYEFLRAIPTAQPGS